MFMHVLSLGKPMVDIPVHYAFLCLETLEVIWCGDLREMFPLDVHVKCYQERQQITLGFLELKRIHLHDELPILQTICGLGPE